MSNFPRYVIMILAITTALCAADPCFSQKQPVEETTDPSPWGVFDQKLQHQLHEQLFMAGYDPKQMAEEAQRIEALTDASERKQARQFFYAHYQDVALRGLEGLARALNSAQAITQIADLRNLLASTPAQIPEGPLPNDIFRIYEVLPTQLFELASTPCLDWMTRLGCLLLQADGRQECVYSRLGQIPVSRLFPATAQRERTGANPHDFDTRSSWSVVEISWSSSADMGSELLQSAELQNILHASTPRAAGFMWPVRRQDRMMCVEMNLHPFNASNISWLDGGYSRAHLSAYGGGSTASSSWNIAFKNALLTLAPVAQWGRSECAHAAQVTSVDSTFSTPEENNSVMRLSSNRRACWFKNLRQAYLISAGYAPFPRDPTDPETWDAIRLDFTSTINTSYTGWTYEWGSRFGYVDVGINLRGFGVLMVRERQ